jgi:uncharacterized protein (DUF1697 family)
MTQYVAFPRGINAGVSMKMEDLRRVFESLGHENVKTVVASGNVLFEAKRTAEATLVRDIEEALAETFGTRIPVVIRTQAELERLAKAKPFANVADSETTRPFVTFLKKKPRQQDVSRGNGYEVLGIYDRAVCSVVDLSGGTTPELMRVLDKEFGPEVTTRSWNTVERVLRAGS